MSGAFGTNWLDLSNVSNVLRQTYTTGFVDISGGPLYVRNNNVYIQGGDLSLSGNLYANYPPNSIPGSAVIGGAGGGGGGSGSGDGRGFVVALGSGNSTFAYTQDGSNGTPWVASDTSASPIFSTAVNNVAWNGSYWLATGNDTLGTIAKSSDGKNWYKPNTNPFLVNIVVGVTDNAIVYSTDEGQNWAKAADFKGHAPSGNDGRDGYYGSQYVQFLSTVIYTGTKWLAGGINQLGSSPDGINWTVSPFSLDIQQIVASGSQIVICGNNISGAAVVMVSTDGGNSYNTPTITDYTYTGHNVKCATDGSGNYILVSCYDTLSWKCNDPALMTWTKLTTSNLSHLSYGVNSNYNRPLDTPYQGSVLSLASNGKLWVVTSSIPDFGQFDILYSYDGITWYGSIHTNSNGASIDLTGNTSYYNSGNSVPSFGGTGNFIVWNGTIWATNNASSSDGIHFSGDFLSDGLSINNGSSNKNDTLTWSGKNWLLYDNVNSRIISTTDPAGGGGRTTTSQAINTMNCICGKFTNPNLYINNPNYNLIEIGSGNQIGISSDGVKWYTNRNPFSATPYPTLALVGNGSDGQLYTSTNFGNTWSTVPGIFDIDTTFIVGVNSNNKIIYSNNGGITWTDSNVTDYITPYGISVNGNSGTTRVPIVYNGNKWIIGGQTRIAISTDGINWTINNSSPFNALYYPNDIYSNGNSWLLFSRGPDSANNHMLVSTDNGVTWTEKTISGLTGVSNYGDNQVKIGYDGTSKYIIVYLDKGWYCTDSTFDTWTPINFGINMNYSRCIVSNGQIWVLGYTDDNYGSCWYQKFAYSYDGITWAYGSVFQPWNGVSDGNGSFPNANGQVTSTITWNGYIWLSSAGYISQDGINWCTPWRYNYPIESFGSTYMFWNTPNYWTWTGKKWLIMDGKNNVTISTNDPYALTGWTTIPYVGTIPNRIATNNIVPYTVIKPQPFGLSAFIPKKKGSIFYSVDMDATGQYMIAGTTSLSASGNENGIFYSNNYGVTWTASNITSNDWRGIAMSKNGNYAYIGNGNEQSGLWISTNKGVTWTQSSSQNSGSINGVATNTSGQYVIIGYSGQGIRTSSDYGQTWSQPTTAANLNIYNLCMSSTGQYCVASLNGSNFTLFSVDYGNTWNASALTYSFAYSWFAMKPDGSLILASDFQNNTGIWYSTDYGNSWQQTNMKQYCFAGIAIDSTGTYAIANCTGQNANIGLGIFYSKDGGMTWSPTNVIAYNSQYGVNQIHRFYGAAMSSNAQYVASAGCRGGLGLYIQNNSTMNQVPIPVYPKATDVFVDASGITYVATAYDASSSIISTTNITDSTKWIKNGLTNLSKGYGVAYNQVYKSWIAVGDGSSNTIAYSTDPSAITWNGVSGSPAIISPAYGVACDGSGGVSVAVGQGTNSIAYSNNGGSVWTGVNTTLMRTGYGIATNSKIWVAVGEDTSNNIIRTSSISPTNWLGCGKVFKNAAHGVAYSYAKPNIGSLNTSWLATGDNGTDPSGQTIAVSSNGINWSLVPLVDANQRAAFSIAYGAVWTGTTWIVTGTGNYTQATTSDPSGIIGWTFSTTGLQTGKALAVQFDTLDYSFGGTAIAWNNSKNLWIAVGNGRVPVATSAHGYQWTAYDKNTTLMQNVKSVAIDTTGNFMVVGYGVPYAVGYNKAVFANFSGNTIVWNSTTGIPDSVSLTSVTYANNQYTTVGYDINSKLLYSANLASGFAWTPVSLPSITGIPSNIINTTGTNYVMVGNNNIILVSQDGASSWTQNTDFSMNTLNFTYATYSSNGKLMIVGNNGSTGVIYVASTPTPTTGTIWTKAYSLDGQFNTYTSGLWTGQYWVVEGQPGQPIYSTDPSGITGWSNTQNNTPYNSFALGNGIGQGPYVPANPPPAQPTSYGNSACWTGTNWLGVGLGNAALSKSLDGQSWLPVFQTAITQGYAALSNGYRTIIVGSGPSSIAYTDDLITITGTSAPTFSIGLCLAYDGKLWIAGGSGGSNSNNLAYSLDGITWNAASQNNFANACYNIALNGVTWIAVGDNNNSNTIFTSTDGVTWNPVSNTDLNSLFTIGKSIVWTGSKWIASGTAGSAGYTIAYTVDQTGNSGWIPVTVSSGLFNTCKALVNRSVLPSGVNLLGTLNITHIDNDIKFNGAVSVANTLSTKSLNVSGNVTIGLTDNFVFTGNYGSWIRPTSNTLYGFSYNALSLSSSGQYICASVAGQGLLISNNYGSTFTFIQGFQSANFLNTTTSATGQYMLSGTNQGYCVSRNYGKSFVEYNGANNNGFSINGFSAMSDDGSIMYLFSGAGGAGIVKSIDYGVTFQSVNTPTILNQTRDFNPIACSSNGRTVYLSFNNGGWLFYKSTNAGVTWTNLQNAPQSCYVISTSGTGQYILVGQSGESCWLSKDYGATWLSSNNNNVSQITGIPNGGYFYSQNGISSTGQYMIVSINNGYVYISKDYGSTWKKNDIPNTNNNILNAAVSRDGSFMAAAGNSCGVFMLQGGFANQPLTTGYLNASFANKSIPGSALSITSESPLDAYINNLNSSGFNVYNTNMVVSSALFGQGRGTSFRQFLNFPTVICTSSTGQYVYVATGMGVFGSSDYGTNYTFIKNDNTLYQTIACSYDGKYIYVISYTDTNLHISTDFGTTWTVSTFNRSDGPIYGANNALATSSTGRYVAFATSDHIYYSSDYGVSCSSIANASGCVAIYMDSTGQKIYYGSGSTLYFSSDAGSNWSSVSTASSIGSISVDYKNNLIYYVAGANLYKSALTTPFTNTSFTSINFTTQGSACMAIDMNGNLIMTAGYDGVYYSNNGGVTISRTDASYNTVQIWRSCAVSKNGQYIYALSTTNSSGDLPGIYKQVCPLANSPYASIGMPVSSLTLTNDASFNGRLFLNSNSLYVNGSLFSGGSSYFATDVSMASRLIVSGDTSFNSRLFLNSDSLYVNGNLFSGGSSYFATDVSMASRLIVSGDISLNSRTFINNINSPGFNVYNTNPVQNKALFGQNTGTMLFSGVSPNNPYGIAISETGQYVYLIVSNVAELYKSSNYGQTWTKLNISATGCFIKTSANGQYVITSSYGASAPSYSTDYGNSWNTSSGISTFIDTTDEYIAMSSTGQYVIFNGGGPRAIYISTNYGQTFFTAKTLDQHTGVAISPDGGFFISITPSRSGSTGVMLYSSNNGSTWGTRYLPFLAFRIAVDSTYNNMIAATNTSRWYSNNINGIFYSRDGGINWNATNINYGNCFDIFLDPGGVYALAAMDSGLYYSTNGGQSWSVVSDNNSIANQGCAISSDLNYIYSTVSGTSNTVYRQTCATSNKPTFSLSIPVTGLSASGDSFINGRLFTTNDVSMTGNVIANNLTVKGALNATFGTSSIAQNSVAGFFLPIIATPVYYFNNTNYGTPINICINSTGQRALILTQNNCLSVCNDLSMNNSSSSATWTSINDDSVLPANAGWIFMEANKNTGQYVLIATNSSDLYFSNNYGAKNSWVNLSGSRGIPSSQSWLAGAISYNTHCMIATTNTTTSYVSRDQGASWTAVTSPYALGPVAIGINGDVLYSLSNGLSTSTDYGTNWTKVGTTTFSTPISISISYGNNGQYIIIPNGGGFYVSKNSGMDFTYYGNNTYPYWANTAAISQNGDFMAIAGYSYNNFNYINISNDFGSSWTVLNSEVGYWELFINGGIIALSENPMYILNQGWRGSSTGIYISNRLLTTNINSKVTITNSASITKNLQVSGMTTIGGNATIGGNVAISGNTKISGTLSANFSSSTVPASAIKGFQCPFDISFSPIIDTILPTNASWCGITARFNFYNVQALANNDGLYINNNQLHPNYWVYVNNDSVLPAVANWKFIVNNKEYSQYLLIADSNNNLYYSNNYGNAGSWTNLSGTGIIPAASSVTWRTACISYYGLVMLVVATSGTTYISKNYGSTWAALNVGDMFRICTSSGGDRIYATINGGTTLLYSTNTGTTWTSGGSYNIYYGLISCNTTGDIVCVADGQYNTNNGIYTSTDYGATFKLTHDPNSDRTYYYNYYQIFMNDGGDFAIALPTTTSGYNMGTYLAISNNSGSSWSPLYNTMGIGPYNSWKSGTITSNASAILLAGNTPGMIYYGQVIQAGISIDINSNTIIRQPLTLTKRANMIDISMTAFTTTTDSKVGGNLIVSGLLSANFANNSIPESTIIGFQYPYNINWSEVTGTILPSNANWVGVGSRNDMYYSYALANNNGLYWNNNNLNKNYWNYINNDSVLPAVANWKFITNDKQYSRYLLIVDSNNNLYLSTNYAQQGSWTNLCGQRNIPEANVVNWQSIFISYFSTVMIVATNAGTYYISRDQGTTWTLKTQPYGVMNSICSSWGGDRVYTTIYGGQTLIYSTDYGVTWNGGGNVNGNVGYVNCNTGGNILCIGDFNANSIWTSSDSGQTFKYTYNNNDGYNHYFQQIAMNEGADLIIGVPRNGVGNGSVAISNDYGTSWTAFSNANGLPWTDWISSTIRNDATTILMAARNGSLYIGTVSQRVINTIINSSTTISQLTVNNRTLLRDVSMTNFSTTTDSFVGGNLIISGNTKVNGTLIANYAENSIPGTSVIGFQYPFNMSIAPITATSLPATFMNMNWKSVFINHNRSYSRALANGSGLYLNFSYLNPNAWTYMNNDSVLPASTNWNFMVSQKYEGRYMLIADASNNLFYSTSYGNQGSWTKLSGNGTIPTAANVVWTTAVICYNGSVMMVLTNNDSYYVSKNYGSTWTYVQNQTIYRIAMNGDGTRIYATNGGTISLSTDYGITWSTLNGTSASPSSIACSYSGEVICVGQNGGGNGGIWVSRNYGASFTQTDPGYFQHIQNITMSNNGDFIVCNQQNFIKISNDYGSTWNPIVAPTFGHPGLNFIMCSLSDDETQLLLCPTYDGSLYLAQISQVAITTTISSPAVFPRGLTVSQRSVLTDVSINNLTISGAVTSKYFNTYANSGFTKLVTPNFGNTFIISSPSCQYILDSNNNYSTNYGATWTTLTTNSYRSGRGKISTNGQYIAAYGALFSSDYGVTWNGVQSNTDFTSLYQAQNQPTTTVMSDNGQYILVSNSALYGNGMRIIVSSDYGASWTNNSNSTAYDADMSSTGQYIVIARVPKTIVSQNIFISVSNNYGASFTDLSSNIMQYYDLHGNYGNSRPSVVISPNGQYIGMYTSGGNQISISSNFGSSFVLTPALPTSNIKLCKIADWGFVEVVTSSNYVYSGYYNAPSWTISPIISSGTVNNVVSSPDLVSYVYVGTSNGIFSSSSQYNTIFSLSGQLFVNQNDTNNYGNLIVFGRTTLAGDVSLNGNTFVITQSSTDNSTKIATTAFVKSAVAAGVAAGGSSSYFGTDVSMTSRLYVGSDVSFGGRLFLTNDASINGNLSIASDMTIGGNFYVKAYTTRQMITELSYQLIIAQDISANGRLFLSNDASINNRLFVGSDASFGTRLFVAGDLSVNGNVNVNGNLTSITQTSTDNSTKVATTAFVKTAVNSVTNSNTGFGGDVSINYRLYVGSDVSLQARLFVNNDASINGNLYLGKNIGIAKTPSYPLDISGISRTSGAVIFGTLPTTKYYTFSGTPSTATITSPALTFTFGNSSFYAKIHCFLSDSSTNTVSSIIFDVQGGNIAGAAPANNIAEISRISTINGFYQWLQPTYTTTAVVLGTTANTGVVANYSVRVELIQTNAVAANVPTLNSITMVNNNAGGTVVTSFAY